MICVAAVILVSAEEVSVRVICGAAVIFAFVCVSHLFRRSCIGVCRGGVCVSDLCRRSCIGVCRGGVCVK